MGAGALALIGATEGGAVVASCIVGYGVSKVVSYTKKEVAVH